MCIRILVYTHIHIYIYRERERYSHTPEYLCKQGWVRTYQQAYNEGATTATTTPPTTTTTNNNNNNSNSNNNEGAPSGSSPSPTHFGAVGEGRRRRWPAQKRLYCNTIML